MSDAEKRRKGDVSLIKKKTPDHDRDEKKAKKNPGEEAASAASAAAGRADANSAASEPSPAEGTAPEKEAAPKEGEKELTEQEVMKLYLEQLAGELRKEKTRGAELDKQLEASKDETRKLNDRLASLSAEYDNYRRRTASEKEGILADAVTKAVQALLPALDSLQKAVGFAQSNPESFEQGVEMTLRQLTDGFKKLGVEEIEAQGAAFDPGVHNAVMHVEDEALGDSVVADVFQKGYKIGDRVIRHAMVKVAN